MVFQSYIELNNYLDDYHRGSLIVLTNGCFDILHVGHIKVLKKCRGIASSLTALDQESRAIVVVAVDSDESVTRLKGVHRPVHTFEDRAAVINTLKPVDFVVKMTTDTFREMVEALQPSVYVKGSEYKESLNPSDLISLEGIGCRVNFCEMVSNRSTTKSIEKINHMISGLE